MATTQQIDVVIQRSGVASILSSQNQTDAEQIHDYLKSQGCTVGRYFEQRGEFAFFAFSIKHPVRETIAQHGGYHLVDRPSEDEIP
jgi:hypothetical protein